MGKGRTPCCEKGRVKKGPWSQVEDLKLINFIQRHGHTNWRSLPKLAGLARCGKSCRLRWVNYLRPDLKRGIFTPVEEETIIRLQSLLGNKWSKIASHLPGRTDNEIKNVWNTHLKKRLPTGRKNNSPDSKSKEMHPTSSKDNITVEPSSSDGSTFDSGSNLDDDKNISNEEPIEIPYDEPSMADLWDSLMLDVDSDQAQSNNHADNTTIENSFGWQFELSENYEHGTIDDMVQAPLTTTGNDQTNKCDRFEESLPSNLNEGLLKVDSMDRYLEIMAWPSSPTYDSYLGF